ncbi:bifunctional phosphoribosylaminoimidazolecarboxamide formyltransferase/IMP cyclohydrolase [Candidatus Poribacteria bacterium]|nr:bifunctional phosphoribosylaminoimidazolecarboxamide formyltransferase/IMP cyclohydrolase [Candidatus Poribacteria bacterium]MYB64239.1 bifunctional phosphoribosylaminoimidazolecarboxamide formyltransferase/IMP cyclohydrolase [Candidatus Poribacteria bacterium]MYF56640.1 bifunctional phosphoribosylaminoimidazolecarboxamide formyltransferase/IMP cyclohydrolase [Candidatus Poribacteria bacterium]MYI93025.1 bifunctional phosphoribosylaminoimidazolecarboxamide formyltransferase/IMP cyclohydrolase
MKKIKRALISTYDKTNLLQIASILVQNDVEILSTGGTAKHLRDADIEIIDVSDYTGFPEMLQGRVKTLHPKIHGGLLADWSNPEHANQAEDNGIKPIDMVICNLYPFEETVAKPDVTLSEAIENIDIGGPTMIRAAAKNYKHVAVLTNPEQYQEIINDLDSQDGCLTEERRFGLAKTAFLHTAHYDSAIATYLTNTENRDEFDDVLTLTYRKAESLRYGENPHQKAAFYRTDTSPAPCAAWAKQRNGPPLSFNNILDLDAALEIVKDFKKPTCAIIKHNNPCGLASADNLKDAFTNALECDRTSAFGSIVGLNRKVTIQTANTIRDASRAGVKIEAVIAPSYTDKALHALSRVENRRILETGPLSGAEDSTQFRNVTGGLLLQEQDSHEVAKEDLQLVTKRKPTDSEIESLLFAWKTCKHVKSNCILLAQDTQTVGIGAGQMSRVDAAIIAVRKAGEKAKDSVLASDAFFPFPDGVEIAGEAGIRAIIQPGGSVNDESVIETADSYGIAMVFTGVRHFRH